MIWSQQQAESLEEMSRENYRWCLVEDSVDNIYVHRRFFHPLYAIFVDESMERWYGIKGTWINMRKPIYVSIQRKPKMD
jgi:hypothetical protein